MTRNERKKLFEECFDICADKALIHRRNMLGELYDLQESADGDYYKEPHGEPLASRWNWMTSFVTGLAPLIGQIRDKSAWLEWANGFYDQYAAKINADYTATMHDIGFLYLPYSVGIYELTGDGRHKKTALTAAAELAKRFCINGRYIEAWSEMNTDDKENRMIVDTMMNIPLLLWAWKQTGHTFFRDVALAHADTVKRVLVREDFSVCHAYLFNDDGSAREEANACGYSNGTNWARGSAWAVYGYAILAKYTGRSEYTELAKNIAGRFLSSKGTGDRIPVWDLMLPADKPACRCSDPGEIPQWDETDPSCMVYNKDSSAAAVMGCALLEIYDLDKDMDCRKAAEDILQDLCTGYFDRDRRKPGMLARCDGRNVFRIFGDYYFIMLLGKMLYGSGFGICW